MALRFIPDPGMVLMCDYQTGFVPPEMTKKRRVIVVSPKFINNRGLCSIVPISTSSPEAKFPFHVRFDAGSYDFLSNISPCWAKCDIISSVSYRRLDRIRIGQHFISPRISSSALEKIQRALLHVIGYA